jgi:hypothetical protein
LQRRNGGKFKMGTFGRSKVVLPLVTLMTVFALSAHAEEPNGPPPKARAKQGQRPAAAQAAPAQGQVARPQGQVARPQGQVARSQAQVARPMPGRPQGIGPGRGDPRFARGGMPAQNFGGRAYHGHLAWEGGRWRHEVHDGRPGWWWDVGGVWYYYSQPMDGPPTYVSDVEVMDDDLGPDGPPVAAVGYPPPPPVGYAPPPPDAASGAVGGAVVGGLLGGLISGRPGGAIAGAIAGGATGAIVGAQAAARPGYYLAQGNCYYRYTSGQYVAADPRACY